MVGTEKAGHCQECGYYRFEDTLLSLAEALILEWKRVQNIRNRKTP